MIWGITDTFRRGKMASKKSKKRNTKIILIVEVIIIALLLAGLLLYLYFANKETFEGDTVVKLEEIELNELSEETKEVLKGYESIALFGVDNRSNGDYSTGNSDSIMVVNINKDTKEIKLISVYRDTYFEVSRDTYRKCNYAYNHGGPEQAIAMLNANLDLNITEYVSVDFYALAVVTDALGGVTVDISDEVAEWMPAYIQEVSQITGFQSNTNVGAGTQHLDGVQTVAYCRIRYATGDDFARAQRQREVVEQLATKGINSDAATVAKIVDGVLSYVSTNISPQQILNLAADMKSYTLAGSRGFPFNRTTGVYGSAGDLVVPTTLESNVAELHEFFFERETYVPSDNVKSTSQYISSFTGTNESSGIRSNY